jgi:hypothetical protein
MPEGGRRHRRASMATIDTTAARLGDPGIGAGCSQEARLPRPMPETNDDAFTRSSHQPSRSHSGLTQAAHWPTRPNHTAPGSRGQHWANTLVRRIASPGRPATGEPPAHPGPGQNVGPKKPRQSLRIRSSWLSAVMVQAGITRGILAAMAERRAGLTADALPPNAKCLHAARPPAV